MKVLVTSMNKGIGKSIVQSQILPAETEHIRHALIEVNELEEKEGYSQELVYDEAQKNFKFEYKEIPKSSVQEQEERIRVLEKALAETLKSQKEDIIGDELEGM